MTMGSATLSLTRATELLGAAARGSEEILGVLDDHALLVVDLDTPGDISRLFVPHGLACVVVGISRRGMIDVPFAGVDVALTLAPSAPSPWITVTDLDQEIDRLSAQVGYAPIAAVTVAQLLRSGGQSLGRDLVIESMAYSTLQTGPEHQKWLENRNFRPAKQVETKTLLVEIRDDQMWLTLDRPKVRNAYNAVLRDELCAALLVACADASIRDIHLAGAGPTFCSGGDLDEFGSRPDPATAHLVRTTRSAALMLGAVAGRLTAHLHGDCVGAGIELAALAGHIVATPDTRIRLPELALGLLPGAGGTASLPRRIGRHRSAWLALTGATIDIDRASSWGLVDDVEKG